MALTMARRPHLSSRVLAPPNARSGSVASTCSVRRIDGCVRRSGARGPRRDAAPQRLSMCARCLSPPQVRAQVTRARASELAVRDAWPLRVRRRSGTCPHGRNGRGSDVAPCRRRRAVGTGQLPLECNPPSTRAPKPKHPSRQVAQHRDVARRIRVRQPLMTLRTFATMGGFNPTPSSLRIGMSTGPNASKSACDSQMSKT
jgi:hypothetical protein